jgi:hypothetical protein
MPIVVLNILKELKIKMIYSKKNNSITEHLLDLNPKKKIIFCFQMSQTRNAGLAQEFSWTIQNLMKKLIIRKIIIRKLFKSRELKKDLSPKE